MRLKGTKYEKIDVLPPNALPIGVFARKQGINHNYVYVKHDRHFHPKPGKNPGAYPGFVIRCWHGTNYVIPD